MFTAKTRIAFALTGVVVCILVTAKALGLVPHRTTAILEGRGRLCEAIAISSSALLAQPNGEETLEAFLNGIVQRDPSLLSAGLRSNGEEFVVETTGHASLWKLPDGRPSNDRFMYVPLGSQTNSWGRLELCFVAVRGTTVGGFLDADAGGLILFAGPACFLVFCVLLGVMLKQLDPSGAVPKRVVDALDNLAEGLLIVDVRDRILLANQAFANVLGVAPPKLVGHHASRLGWLSDETEISNDLPWQKALEEGRPLSNMALQLRGSDGALRSFVVNASPVVAGQDGKFRGTLVTFDDVTSLEKHKADLGVAKEAAESANRAKSQFLANMSHEIRTPMNAILGFTDVLRRGIEEDESKKLKYLDTIHSSGSHLINLINDILDLSKIEAGKLDLEIAPVSPYQLTSEVVDVLQVRAAQQGIFLRLSVDGLIPASIETDATRLRQTLINIIGNAIKFTEQGGVSIACRLLQGAHSLIEFEIEDTGIGMTEDQVARIFNPFEQADSSVTRRFGGTGLGLSISKRFAEALGGSICVRSEPGEGSVFTIRVATGAIDRVTMVDEIAAAESLNESRKSREQDISGIQLRPASILVVDDGESNREFLTVVLRRFGLNVIEAENGQQAIDAVEAGDFDLILMDMQMPVLDGYAATRKLREQGVTIPIVALTANAMREDRRKCEAAGCDGFLPKPVNMDDLTQVLRERLAAAPKAASASASCTMPVKSNLVSTPGNSEREPAEGYIFSTLPTKDDVFRSIVSKFVERLTERLETMCDSFENRDYQQLADDAHWLKGAGGTVGFGDFTEPAKQLETFAKNQSDDDLEFTLGKLIDLAARIRLDPEFPPIHPEEAVDSNSSSQPIEDSGLPMVTNS